MGSAGLVVVGTAGVLDGAAEEEAVAAPRGAVVVDEAEAAASSSLKSAWMKISASRSSAP